MEADGKDLAVQREKGMMPEIYWDRSPGEGGVGSRAQRGGGDLGCTVQVNLPQQQWWKLLINSICSVKKKDSSGKQGWQERLWEV